MQLRISTRGVSLVEVIIAAAIMVLVFGALMSGSRLMLIVLSESKAQAAALSVASQQMEYLRSFSYSALGTQSGVPSGVIPQTASTTLNGIDFSIRNLVQYVDDDADGFGGADSNGILSDYKQIKVEVSWNMRGETKAVSLVSNVVPPGMETTAGGGTIRVNVFDAAVQPVAGAEVRFVNNSLGTPIDTIRYTGPTGVAYLSGAPVGADYEITVSGSGYSTDGTYNVTVDNPNPSTPPIAVLEGQVSTMNFQIDELSSFTLATQGVPNQVTVVDDFSSAGAIATTSQTTITGSTVVLTDTAGVYDASGMVWGATTTPVTIDRWYRAMQVASTTIDTAARLHVTYDDGGVLALVPDIDLPGNSAGTSGSTIDLTALDAGMYPSLGLAATLTTASTSLTPVLHEWTLEYVQSQSAVTGVDAELIGTKSIGTDGSGQAVLKNLYTGTTDGSGEWSESAVEFDQYDLVIDTSSYSVYELCPTPPLTIDPDESVTVNAVLGPLVPDYLRVNVTESDGTHVSGATVRLQNSGVDQVQTTSLCGQVFFGSGLYDDNGYLLTVSAPGYGTETMASTTVSGSSTVHVILN